MSKNIHVDHFIPVSYTHRKLFALNAFYSANKTIIGRKLEKNTEKFLMEYWKTVVEHMMQWQALQNKEITKVDLREQYIATQNIVIQALGRVGNYFYNNPNINMHECIEKLDKVDWNRNARIWYLRAISETGRIITNKKAALLIANVLKAEMKIPLSEEEQKAEDALQKTIGEQVGDKNGN